MGLFCGRRCQDRKDARVEARTERVALRQETKQVAFEHGMDPNAAMWGGLSSIAGSVGGIFGKPGSSTGSSFVNSNAQGGMSMGGMSPLLMLGLAALAWLMFKRK